MTNAIKLTFAGGVGSVTGANFLLEFGELKLLVDCGIYQGPGAQEKNREDFPYGPHEIDALLVTHAHMDHIGRIPKLVRDGFEGKIYSTSVTKRMAPIMYDDAISIMEYERKRKPELSELYGKKDVEKTLSLWQEASYETDVRLSGDVSFTLRDAGHILGSAFIEVDLNGRKVIFSGDLGNEVSALVRETHKPEGADYMVIESVYGDRVHENIEERKDKLRRAIEEVSAKDGTLIIPAFSLERTQIILHEINDFFGKGQLDPLPVYLDSPLAIKLTEIYKGAKAELFNKHAKSEIKGGDDIFSFPTLNLTMGVEQSKEIFKDSGAKIVIAGSGMSSGGRVIHHEKHFLSDPKSKILFVGYQSPGSLGRQIQDGAKKLEIMGKKINIRAGVDTIRGFSAHADRDTLLSFVESTAETLKKVFVAMGEPKASMFLAQRINDYLDVKAVVPEEGETITLD